MQRAFVASAVAAGYPAVTDFNGREPFGAGPYPMNTRMGLRLNAGMTYLDAATRARPGRGGPLSRGGSTGPRFSRSTITRCPSLRTR